VLVCALIFVRARIFSAVIDLPPRSRAVFSKRACILLAVLVYCACRRSCVRLEGFMTNICVIMGECASSSGWKSFSSRWAAIGGSRETSMLSYARLWMHQFWASYCCRCRRGYSHAWSPGRACTTSLKSAAFLVRAGVELCVREFFWVLHTDLCQAGSAKLRSVGHQPQAS